MITVRPKQLQWEGHNNRQLQEDSNVNAFMEVTTKTESIKQTQNHHNDEQTTPETFKWVDRDTKWSKKKR